MRFSNGRGGYFRKVLTWLVDSVLVTVGFNVALLHKLNEQIHKVMSDDVMLISVFHILSKHIHIKAADFSGSSLDSFKTVNICLIFPDVKVENTFVTPKIKNRKFKINIQNARDNDSSPD
ncbi:hypothetical protein PUN28_019106 [Cardiocondyla obscurior]|uniref:Uncharacterized protein n=1 Tax=Cardiocondyla obscurior TaxID=286306 RepID=A0AAW2EED6_9HYME